MSGPEVAEDLVRLAGDGGEGGGVHLAGAGNGPLDHVLGHVVVLLRSSEPWSGSWLGSKVRRGGGDGHEAFTPPPRAGTRSAAT